MPIYEPPVNLVKVARPQFTLTQGKTSIQVESCVLPAKEKIEVPPLCHGVISHGMEVIVSGPVLMVGLPNIFMERSLLVECTTVEDGEVVTKVFNLSHERIIIRRGQAVSQLVAL